MVHPAAKIPSPGYTESVLTGHRMYGDADIYILSSTRIYHIQLCISVTSCNGTLPRCAAEHVPNHTQENVLYRRTALPER